MDWENILKRKRMNVDGRNHDDILLDLRRDIGSLIEKAAKEFEGDFADEMISEYGAKDLKEYLNFMVKFLDKELPMTISENINNAINTSNRLLDEKFERYSPSTEGEMRAERESERRSDAQREINAERYYE
tara:strand:- start:2306 stop:2698 length:393 start_codon:yes stop_codon:yes gene_type:complete